MRNTILAVLAALAGLMFAAAPAYAIPKSRAPMSMRGQCSFRSTVSYPQGAYVGLGKCNTEQISPATNTPDGYVLRKGVRVKSADGKYYVYKTYTDASYELNSHGVIVSRVNEHWKETATGRSSNYWRLEMYDDYQYGNHYVAFYDYYCGVNIKHHSDPTCDTWSGNSRADGHASGLMWAMGTHRSGTAHPFAVYKNFGSKSGTKFPMFNNRIQWSDGVRNIGDDLRWGYKIRGWDVCDTVRTTRLCDGTGNGH
jgi:hypothetical protein